MPPRKKSTIEEPIIEPVTEPELPPEDETPVIQEDTVTFKRSHFYAVLTVLAFAAGILLGYTVWGTDSVTATALVPPAADQPSGPVIEAPVTEQPQYRRYDIPMGDS
jgi:hypothetical protein